MWKYVTRRVKDSFERTYNVLDVRRTWTCGSGGQDAIQHPQSTSKPSSVSPTSESDDKFKASFGSKKFGTKREHGKKPNPNVDDRIFCPFKRRAAIRRAAAAQTAANSNVRIVKNPNEQNLVNFCTEQKWDRNGGHEQFRKKFGHHRYQCNFQKNVLEALTWVNIDTQSLFIKRNFFFPP